MSHGGWYGTVDLRNAINNGLVEGPRMQVAGPGIVNTNKGNVPFNPNGAHRECRRASCQRPVGRSAKRFGNKPTTASTGSRSTAPKNTRSSPTARWSITPSFTLAETQAIVDEAHRKGLKVACHAYGGEGLHNCIEAGVDVPTHGLDLDDEALKMLLQKHLPLTSTFFDLSIEDAREMRRW